MTPKPNLATIKKNQPMRSLRKDAKQIHLPIRKLHHGRHLKNRPDKPEQRTDLRRREILPQPADRQENPQKDHLEEILQYKEKLFFHEVKAEKVQKHPPAKDSVYPKVKVTDGHSVIKVPICT